MNLETRKKNRMPLHPNISEGHFHVSIFALRILEVYKNRFEFFSMSQVEIFFFWQVVSDAIVVSIQTKPKIVYLEMLKNRSGFQRMHQYDLISSCPHLFSFRMAKGFPIDRPSSHRYFEILLHRSQIYRQCN